MLIFAGFGVWVSFSKRTDMTIFALIIGLTGLYVSATFARLMVYSSIAIVILASIGLYELTRSILQNRPKQNCSAIGLTSLGRELALFGSV